MGARFAPAGVAPSARLAGLVVLESVDSHKPDTFALKCQRIAVVNAGTADKFHPAQFFEPSRKQRANTEKRDYSDPAGQPSCAPAPAAPSETWFTKR